MDDRTLSLDDRPDSGNGRPSCGDGPAETADGGPSSVCDGADSVYGRNFSRDDRTLSLDGRPDSLDDRPLSLDDRPDSRNDRTFPVYARTECLESRSSLQIQYTAGSSGKDSNPLLNPYALIMRDRRWILVARCHNRNEILTYSLHRLSAVEMTDDEFTVDDSIIEHYLATDYAGYPSSSPVQTVRLFIPADAPAYIREKCWKPGETRTTDSEGNLTIEFRTASVWAVERDVLAEAGWVEIVEPAVARENVKKAAQRMARVHGDK